MRRVAVAAGLLGLCAGAAAGQGSTDLFLVELSRDGGALHVTAARRVTDRDGYDNQPQFTPDGRAILYTSIDAAGQADIRRWDLATGRDAAFTHTAPESEYSATPMAGGRFSVIRVEADSVQRLWSFAADGTDPRLVLPGVAPVGYHAWLDDDHLALFVLGQPATLVLATVSTGETHTLARDIGRSLHRIPGSGRVSYVQRTDGRGEIRAFDPATGSSERLVEQVDGNEFHAWLADATLLSARGSTLLAWRAGAADWAPVADLAPFGIADISRLAVSPDGRHLAVVGAH